MKTKFSRILVAVLILTLMLSVLAACGTDEQSLDGMYIVTFKFNGGALRTSVTLVQGEIYHGYKPNSLAIDVSKYTGNKLTKDGYVFVGWYTKDGTSDGDWGKMWNFASDRVTQDMTLYAMWESEIVYSYTVYLVDDEGEQTALGTYKVSVGDKFDDKYKYGTNLVVHNRTFLGYYSDPELKTEWNDDTTHPGGEESLDIPVYVKSMQGVWTFVSTYSELIAAKGENIWLTANIDCGGNELYMGDYNGTLYGGGGSGMEQEPLAEGECYTISNFVVPNSGNDSFLEYTIFGTLGENAQIKDVKFVNASISIVATRTTRQLKVAALSKKATDGCVISNVTVTGSYSVDLSAITGVASKEETLAQAQDAIANINNAIFEENINIDLQTFHSQLEQKQD